MQNYAADCIYSIYTSTIAYDYVITSRIHYAYVSASSTSVHRAFAVEEETRRTCFM